MWDLDVGLMVLGGLVAAKWAVQLLIGVVQMSKPSKAPTYYGKWVAISGATDGIGKAMAFEYAARGMSVLLISRTESKLVAVEKELQAKFGDIEVRHLAIDYSNFDAAAQAKVKAAFESLNGTLGILVNNVGMSYPFPLYFHELSDDELSGLLELNVMSTTWMTRLALPIMLENKKGSIVNIGSAAGLQPSPLLAVYSATKAYVETLSHSLHTEYASKGISVQCQVPLFIVSKLSKFKRSSAFIPTAEVYAKEAIATMGKGPVVSPHTLHNTASGMMDMLPSWVVQSGSLSYHLGIRKLGMRKRAREAGELPDGPKKTK